MLKRQGVFLLLLLLLLLLPLSCQLTSSTSAWKWGLFLFTLFLLFCLLSLILLLLHFVCVLIVSTHSQELVPRWLAPSLLFVMCQIRKKIHMEVYNLFATIIMLPTLSSFRSIRPRSTEVPSALFWQLTERFVPMRASCNKCDRWSVRGEFFETRIQLLRYY